MFTEAFVAILKAGGVKSVKSAERFHQGITPKLIKGEAGSANDNGAIARRSRLGGFLNYYHREAA